jgi:hypothetical protein
MKHLTKLAFLLTSLITGTLNCQPPTLLDSTNSFINQKCRRINPIGGFMWWKCDFCQREELFTTFKSHTGLGDDDSMHIDCYL